MSKQSVLQMLGATASNRALAEALEQTLDSSEDLGQAVVELGARHGFTFTAQEFGETIVELQQRHGGELSDDQLESVAGGASIDPVILQIPTPVFRRLRSFEDPLTAFEDPLTARGGFIRRP